MHQLCYEFFKLFDSSAQSDGPEVEHVAHFLILHFGPCPGRELRLLPASVPSGRWQGSGIFLVTTYSGTLKTRVVYFPPQLSSHPSSISSISI